MRSRSRSPPQPPPGQRLRRTVGAPPFSRRRAPDEHDDAMDGWRTDVMAGRGFGRRPDQRPAGRDAVPARRGRPVPCAGTERADPLGFHIDGTPNPSSCRHYQAITRVDAPDGTPHFLLTRSGNTPNVPGPNEWSCDDSDGETRNGHLVVVRMDSRPNHGERLRSNRLRKDLIAESHAATPVGPGPSRTSRSSAAIPPTPILPAALA